MPNLGFPSQCAETLCGLGNSQPLDVVASVFFDTTICFTLYGRLKRRGRGVFPSLSQEAGNPSSSQGGLVASLTIVLGVG